MKEQRTIDKIAELETTIAAANAAEKVDAINLLAFEIRNSDTQHAISLCKQAQQLSSEINYSDGNATALTNEAFCYVQITDYELGMEKLFEALAIFEESKNEKGIAQVHYNLCLIYFRFSDFNSGLDNIVKALAYFKKVNDNAEIARCYFQMGFLYNSLNDSTSAIEYFNQSIELSRENKNKAVQAASIMGLGQVYLNVKEYDKSAVHLLESMAIREQIEDWRGYAAALNAYMTLCFETDKYKEAEEISIKGIKLTKELGDKMGVSRFMLDLGKIYFKQNKIDEAEQTILDALEIANKINLRMAMGPAHSALSEIYELKGDFENALLHYKIFHKVKEEMLNTTAAMKAKSIQLMSKIENAQQEAEINRLKNVELKNAYNIIAEKNKDITDSINYARRIQQAKLPKKEEILSSLPQSFVLFKPKDIVSGDFYFFKEISAGTSLVFLAAADCTGHGVPGAFMSMIGSERLDDAVSQTSNVSEILKQLNKGIKASLRQSDSEESTKDGMDISLVSLNLQSGATSLNYAGANRPLWIVPAQQLTTNNHQLIEIKATKKAIGGYTKDNEEFEEHEIKLNKGDTFYLFTDGYADQFNGKDGKKLMAKRFKEIVLNIQNKTMEEQELFLNDFIENWKAGAEQVDDILIIGVRI